MSHEGGERIEGGVGEARGAGIPSHRYTARLAGLIEAKWQDRWDAADIYRAPNPGEPGFRADQPKFYALDMFPYPSGAGLHVGHPLGYIATDIVARYRRMLGFNVLHAMGFDAFGLPAEQYAIETGTHPRVTTEKNIETFRRQLRRLGMGHERRRSVATTDVGFYKWTQWIFLQMYNAWFDPEAVAPDGGIGRARPIAELMEEFESGRRETGGRAGSRKAWAKMNGRERAGLIDSYRLAFLADVDVNWCPALGTVLANEEVTADGRSERGDHPVHKRPLRQWMMRITAYADRLLADLDTVEWPEPIRQMQRNWIGRSEGAHIDFESGRRRIRVFTTRPDTLAGATYLVVAPEHPLVDELVGDGAQWGATVPEEWKGKFPGSSHAGDGPMRALSAYRAWSAGRSEVERQAESAKEKTGVFTGAYALNPLTGARIPIFLADYVLMGYGTGAIMAVPAHDERDFDFARQFSLPIRDVVYPRIVMALCFYALHATAEEARGEQWFSILADFLGIVTSRDVAPDGFEAALLRVRFKRRDEADGVEDVGGGETGDPWALRELAPGSLGARRGATKTTWLEAIESIGFDSFRQLQEWFARGEFFKGVGGAFTGTGHAVNSPLIEGLATAEAKAKLGEWLEAQGRGGRTTQYKLRDWLFSRQRYWGEPFPIVYEENDEAGLFPIALPESELPVMLPDLDDYRPLAGEGPDAPPRPPLGRAREWAHATLDLGHGPRPYRRELNTMPQWAGSCWYYLRYLDPQNQEAMVGREAERYWMVSRRENAANGGADAEGCGYESGRHHAGGVDLYVGGVEHAVLHLLYARFWHKALFDLGHVSTPEPFGRLFNQGYIQAPAFKDERGVYVEAARVAETGGKFSFEGREVRREFGKMGKSLRNVVTPDDVCEEFGADTMRLYEMYMGPLEQSKPWNPRDIVGVFRFLQRVWRNLVDEETGASRVVESPADEETRRMLHRTIASVRDDLERLSFNTAIAKIIELNNHIAKACAETGTPREVAEAMALMLAPITPHVAEEFWERINGPGAGSVVRRAFPEADPALLVETTVEIPVQIAGKVRGKIIAAAGASPESIEALALADEKVRAFLEGKAVKKIVVVPGRMVNIVTG